MRGRSLSLVAFAAVFLGLGVITPTLGAVPIDSVGKTGAWSVADTNTDAALRCSYDSSDLASLTVAPPQVNAIGVRKRKVGWEFQVWRSKWWQSLPDTSQWYLAYSSGITKASATRSQAAVFAPGQWTVPARFRTAYDQLKIRLVIHWYARNNVREVGHATAELQYYGVENVGVPFDSTTSTFGPGACPGSFDEPQFPADLGTRAPLPAGFVRMSHWRPYWKSASETVVQGFIDELTRMHQTGIVLTGVETGNKYALPADVAHYLTMFRNAGITPYLALWMARFDDAETNNALRAWQDGNGQWGGIVLDVEAGLMATVNRIGRGPAAQAVQTFFGKARPVASFIAFSTMAIPSDYPDMLYSELNALSDIFMPQLYFNGDDQSALDMLDGMQASVDYESQSWSAPPKPIIPVVNDWGPNSDVQELNNYVQIAFERYGAVSAWRLHPQMREDVKDLWGTFDP